MKFSALPLLFLAGCVSSPPSRTRETQSIEGAQRAFFPDRYDYSVGDFVLSLPIRYYECTMTRLAYARKILETGFPQPVLEQKKYLTLAQDALAPKRHFLVLDQRHLLIFSEYFELENGYPPTLEILQRHDASWTDISNAVLPKWTRSPKTVRFSPDFSSFTVTAAQGVKTEEFHWAEGRLKSGAR